MRWQDAAGRYRPWVDSRLTFMDCIFPPGFWRGKRVLEVGAGHGWVGDGLAERGALVTQTDGKPEYLRPDWTLLDLDGPISVPPHDVVVAFGVLYHVLEPLRVLDTLCNVAPVMVLEGEVLDSDDPLASATRSDGAWDGAANGRSTLMSAATFERYWDTFGWRYRRYDDARLNTEADKYDWILEHTHGAGCGHRRFWVAWRSNMPSPVVPL